MRTHAILCVSLFFASSVWADTMPIDVQLLGSYQSNGVYNLNGLGSWNGQPVADSNRPSDLQAQLAATISFYASRSDQNVLFVQVADVITTNGSWWSGLAFDNVSQTGIDFSLPSNKSLGSPGFSDQYANPNEALFTGNYTETVPLSTTPGYILDVLGPNTYSIHTSNGAEYAFGTWGYVNGVHRIEGGGVFELVFPENINVLAHIDFSSADVESVYGQGNQLIPAIWQGPDGPPSAVPEPSSVALLVTVLFAVASHFRASGRRAAPRR